MTKQEVTALKPFWDDENGRYVKTGETVEVSEVRAGELARNSLAEKPIKPAAKTPAEPKAPAAPKAATTPRPAAKKPAAKTEPEGGES